MKLEQAVFSQCIFKGHNSCKVPTVLSLNTTCKSPVTVDNVLDLSDTYRTAVRWSIDLMDCCTFGNYQQYACGLTE